MKFQRTKSDLPSLRILIVVLPNFNLAATAAFIDPFRAANYLEGQPHFRWVVASIGGGELVASNGMTISADALADCETASFDLIIVSSSWTPEAYDSPILGSALRRGARAGATLGGIDTGAFILARFGLLGGRRATVHYEHLDALIELHPDVKASDHLFVLDGDRITCSGGEAATDLALHLVARTRSADLANRAARYLFHEKFRPQGTRQNSPAAEPFGSTVPATVRMAVQVMEENLESPISIPDICQRVGISQRQLGRLFHRFVRRSPVLYYRDIRLDRARGLVTQTEISLSEIAIASGFAGQVHFSRAYRERFGMPPMRDRIEGRIPFEFRAWPLHQPSMLASKKHSSHMAKKGKRKAKRL